MEDPFEPDGGFVVLRGSLAPRGSIFKRSAAPAALWTYRGPALVFDDYRTALERSLDPSLAATPDTVLVVRNAGPAGAPGMPEIDVIPSRLAWKARCGCTATSPGLPDLGAAPAAPARPAVLRRDDALADRAGRWEA